MDSGIISALTEIADSLDIFSESNAILYIPQHDDTNGLIQDSETGNWILPEVQSLEVTARLSQKKTDSIPLEGLNYSAIYVEGFLVEPKSLSLPLPRSVECSFAYEGTNRKAVFYSLEKMSDTIVELGGLSSAFGQPIAGWIQITEGD